MGQLQLFVKGESLDLYEDSSITLKKQLKDIQDITKLRTDYTQSFIVPTTQRNNRILRYWYNYTMDNDTFDNLSPEPGVIKINGFLYSYGNVKIESVSYKEGIPTNYMVRYTALTTNIKTIFGDDTLQDLFTDDDSLDHKYNMDTVKAGLSGTLFGDDLIYPLYSIKSSWLNTLPSGYVPGEPQDIGCPWSTRTPTPYQYSGIRFHHLKPAIKLKKIIDKIEEVYDITIGGEFFNISDSPESNNSFEKMYMWCHHYKETIPDGSTELFVTQRTHKILRWDNRIEIPAFATGDEMGDTITWTGPTTNNVITRLTYTNGADHFDLLINDVEVESINNPNLHSGTSTQIEFAPITINNGDTIQIREYGLHKKSKVVVDEILVYKTLNPSDSVFYATGYGIKTIYADFQLKYEIPKMKLIDFINGIIQTFNLVVTTRDAKFWVFNKFNRSFSNEVDLSKYLEVLPQNVIDTPKYDNIEFSVGENDSLNHIEFENINNRTFGSQDVYLDNGYSQSLSVKIPFSFPLISGLIEGFFNGNEVNYRVADPILPVFRSYKGVENGIVASDGTLTTDSNLETVVPDPMIFYKGNVIDCTLNDMALVETEYDEISFGRDIPLTSYLNCNSVYEYEPGKFTALSYSGDGEIYYGLQTYDKYREDTPGDNFNLYAPNWSQIIQDGFKQNGRIIRVKGNLPSHVILNLNMTDIILVGGRRYYMNKLDTDLTTGDVKIDLLNIV